MKKASQTKARSADRDTMRPDYDFSLAARGVTAGRYADGTNIVVIDPDLSDVFPDSAAVNSALRALAPLLRGNISKATIAAKAKAVAATAKKSKPRSAAARRREA